VKERDLISKLNTMMIILNMVLRLHQIKLNFAKSFFASTHIGVDTSEVSLPFFCYSNDPKAKIGRFFKKQNRTYIQRWASQRRVKTVTKYKKEYWGC
jgi:hypothetical protein